MMALLWGGEGVQVEGIGVGSMAATRGPGLKGGGWGGERMSF